MSKRVEQDVAELRRLDDTHRLLRARLAKNLRALILVEDRRADLHARLGSDGPESQASSHRHARMVARQNADALLAILLGLERMSLDGAPAGWTQVIDMANFEAPAAQ